MIQIDNEHIICDGIVELLFIHVFVQPCFVDVYPCIRYPQLQGDARSEFDKSQLGLWSQGGARTGQSRRHVRTADRTDRILYGDPRCAKMFRRLRFRRMCQCLTTTWSTWSTWSNRNLHWMISVDWGTAFREAKAAKAWDEFRAADFTPRWCHPFISWSITPSNYCILYTIVITTINHCYCSYKPT